MSFVMNKKVCLYLYTEHGEIYRRKMSSVPNDNVASRLRKKIDCARKHLILPTSSIPDTSLINDRRIFVPRSQLARCISLQTV